MWQLVDDRIDELRRLPFAELRRRAAAGPEVDILDSDAGRFRRRSRVVLLSEDRVGIKVCVDCEGRRPRAERGIIVTPQGRLAPEWSFGNEPPRDNPFVFGLKATVIGVGIAVVLMVVFLLLA